eukprot:CAMPEP_0197295540 /NCGR_PEP_ID=MMETSP0890-20130614/35836_1 /TAXON_ID=44058 ORGANISM="Aureoumbra lagunensis, Strain CCMP1510" /NCGR_SAMPLE_ID=MMETSP0890 /ASSEMBLY_ACC=CAM_ASM_000533 /LENGTH=63 /DNA_ID=CAMNT_0042771607 /DNA_START=116 /DNA_END=307 /DNA_ORIENTATION=+
MPLASAELKELLQGKVKCTGGKNLKLQGDRLNFATDANPRISAYLASANSIGDDEFPEDGKEN